jgi:N-acetylglutamate synthase-like GNAT family acetyltransferase
MARRKPRKLFGEKDFYLEEFRGRSVLIAVAPALASGRPNLGPLVETIGDLVRNGTRVLLWWPMVEPLAARRLLATLGRERLRTRRRPGPAPRIARLRFAADDLAGVAADAARAALWAVLRRQRLCVLLVDAAVSYPRPATHMAAALKVAKLVLLDPQGALLSVGTSRLSFVDAGVLETVLRQGEAEWSGLGEHRPLLAAVREALRDGVESVNLCSPEGIADELFTYGGSGTLFTPGDYCAVAPLGLDDFAQADRLLQRGQREGMLKFRTADERAQVLAVGFGATIWPRHLAGVAGLLVGPYEAERAGEIVGLYTITRFKGEGVGERLVSRLLAEAEQRELDYVFACAIDERAQQFFTRLGFGRMSSGEVPPAKWIGYDARRRARLAIFRRSLAHPAAAAVTA